MKLFGSKRSGSMLAKNRANPPRTYNPQNVSVSGGAAVAEAPAVRKKNPLKVLALILAIVLFFEVCYFVCVYSNNGFISKWRNIYITTAMDTLSHKWLATAFIPPDVIDGVMAEKQAALKEDQGLESSWSKPEEEAIPETPVVEKPTTELDTVITTEEDAAEAQARAEFYNLFYELDVDSMEAHLEKHPELLANGWEGLYINEAGLDDEGTDIYTRDQKQVLAIDAPNKILLLRIKGSGYQGVLAIAKDPSLLTVRPSSQLGICGESAGTIAKQYNGVLAMTGSGFIDPDGNGNGGILAGYAMCNGVEYGTGHCGYGYKRLELHEDNLMYLKDAGAPVGESTTDAVEFLPAMIVDGNITGTVSAYNGLHPRACIGQSDKYEVLMLAIEGRQPTRSLGTDLTECAKILKEHGCMQALNVDGGTSAMLWFDGEEVIKCSNAALPEGRGLPTAFVYARADTAE